MTLRDFVDSHRALLIADSVLGDRFLLTCETPVRNSGELHGLWMMPTITLEFRWEVSQCRFHRDGPLNGGCPTCSGGMELLFGNQKEVEAEIPGPSGKVRGRQRSRGARGRPLGSPPPACLPASTACGPPADRLPACGACGSGCGCGCAAVSGRVFRCSHVGVGLGCRR